MSAAQVVFYCLWSTKVGLNCPQYITVVSHCSHCAIRCIFYKGFFMWFLNMCHQLLRESPWNINLFYSLVLIAFNGAARREIVSTNASSILSRLLWNVSYGIFTLPLVIDVGKKS